MERQRERQPIEAVVTLDSETMLAQSIVSMMKGETEKVPSAEILRMLGRRVDLSGYLSHEDNRGMGKTESDRLSALIDWWKDAKKEDVFWRMREVVTNYGYCEEELLPSDDSGPDNLGTFLVNAIAGYLHKIKADGNVSLKKDDLLIYDGVIKANPTLTITKPISCIASLDFGMYQVEKEIIGDGTFALAEMGKIDTVRSLPLRQAMEGFMVRPGKYMKDYLQRLAKDNWGLNITKPDLRITKAGMLVSLKKS